MHGKVGNECTVRYLFLNLYCKSNRDQSKKKHLSISNQS